MKFSSCLMRVPLMPFLFAAVAAFGSASAAVFDFSESGFTSANNSQNGGAGNVNIADASVATVTPTVDGIQLTLTAVSTSGTATLGANSQGFGVSTNGEGNSNNTRIENDKGESLRFSFDAPVTLDSVRFGNFTDGESATLSFISGTNPFTSGTSLTIAADGNQGPADDIILSNNPIVSGGIEPIASDTVIELTITGGTTDALLNEFTVSSAISTFIAPSFPSPSLTENPDPGFNLGSTTIASGNAKGQSFSLPASSTISSFVFECTDVSAYGAFEIQLFRAMDDKPWILTPVFTGIATLPAGLARDDLLQIDLATPTALTRGSYLVTLEGIASTEFTLRLTQDPLYPTGVGARNNSSAGWRPLINPTWDLVFAVLGAQDAPDPTPVGKPNVIFILADDLGWTDIQCGSSGPNVLDGVNYGSGFYQTPNLARLAGEGLSFTHAFVHPNCAPTRAAFISGQYPSRSGNGVYHVQNLNRFTGTAPTFKGPPQNEDVPVAHTLWSEALQDGGYVTAHLGKFHVANHETGSATLPENQGFDFNFGGKENGNPGNFFAAAGTWNAAIGPGLDAFAPPYTSNYITANLDPYANGNDPSTLDTTDKHLTDAMGDAATAFIRDHTKGSLADRPFFMQVHFYAVHTPIQDRPDLTTKYNGLTPTATHSDADYAGLVEGMDQNIGRILDQLEDPNGDGNTNDSITSETLVIFISDNGGHIGPTDNDPLRHRKGSFFNGGIRVPLIIRQPGTVPAAAQTDTLVHAVDFYPTLLEHADIPLPAGITFDGESFAAHMLDPVGNPRDRSPIFYHFPGYLDTRTRPVEVAIARIDGEDYKLIYNYDLNYIGNNPNAEDQSEGLTVLTDRWQLFKFSQDISEQVDLIDGSYSNHLLYGQIADSMAADLDAWLNQSDPDWEAHKLLVRAIDAPVDYPGPDVPDVSVPKTQTFRLTTDSPEVDGDQVTLTWNSESGFSYQIEASNTLTDWAPIGDAIQAIGVTTSFTFADPALILNPAPTERFYRVRLLP